LLGGHPVIPWADRRCAVVKAGGSVGKENIALKQLALLEGELVNVLSVSPGGWHEGRVIDSLESGRRWDIVLVADCLALEYDPSDSLVPSSYKSPNDRALGSDIVPDGLEALKYFHNYSLVP
jgi:hypothetical protein